MFAAGSFTWSARLALHRVSHSGRYLAFVFAGSLVLLSPAWSGVILFGDWPAWPMTPTEGAALVLATIVALLAAHADRTPFRVRGAPVAALSFGRPSPEGGRRTAPRRISRAR